jgi:hypothetical protein
MAKSRGNIAQVGELLDGGMSARALRYALLAVHYRAGLDFSDASLAAAGAALDRLDTLVLALESYREDGPGDPELDTALASAVDAFGAALDDDLNASGARRRVRPRTRPQPADPAAVVVDRRRRPRAGFLRDLGTGLGAPDAASDELDVELSRCSTSVPRRIARDWAASDNSLRWPIAVSPSGHRAVSAGGGSRVTRG